jgi:ABC-type lipoprotein export system ATPase subunit
MRIELQQLTPNALKNRLKDRSSELWQQSLVFDQGEFIKIQAPSGTGKTTLQHILYCMRDDYEGVVLMNGKPIKNITDSELAFMRQQEIAVVFQDLKLFPNLTARENISLKRMLAPDFCDEAVIDQMAKTLGIESILDQKAGICSYGEQQRIVIIRALVHPFKWLLMDEPFSHLDEQNIHLASKLIQEACHERGAGLMITDLESDNHFNYHRTLFL